MRVILAIANHELRRLFKSPLAWVIMAVVQFLLAQLFIKYWEIFETRGAQYSNIGLTEIVVTSLFQSTAIILLMVTPFITMRGFSEERRSGTMRLLLSSPVSITQLVLGKYLSILGFLLLIVGMVSLMPLSLGMGTSMDYYQLLAGVLGLSLLISSFAAIGLFISTLTQSTAIAAVGSFGTLFLLWILNLAGNSGSEQVAAVLSYVSLLTHYNNLLDGLFDLSDVTYYLIMTITFLVLCVWRLDSERIS
ncbi:MAG: ABC transporter permease subunit [Thiotrichales bacterium]|nr:ABC transporter permease subunit [Thiotrichales bacterium]